MAEQLDAVDFAVAAFQEAGSWRVHELNHDLVADVGTVAHALRRLSYDGAAVGMIALDEDFFLLLRVTDDATRLLLSDITAADEWELAASAVDWLGLPQPEDDDEQVPAGDLDLLGDLGLPASELAELLDDTDSYPDEILSDVAQDLGFGELFDDVVGIETSPA